MFDIKTTKIFLKRVPYPSITIKDLYIGSTVTIYSRQMKIAGFDDDFTKNAIGFSSEKSIVVCKMSELHSILRDNSGLKLVKLKMGVLNE